MQIEVTQQHIDIAPGIERYSGDYRTHTCPIALAMKAKGALDVSVRKWAAHWIDEEGKRYEAVLPEKAQAFIEDYDAKKPVKPFAFDVEWVHYTHVLGLPV